MTDETTTYADDDTDVIGDEEHDGRAGPEANEGFVPPASDPRLSFAFAEQPTRASTRAVRSERAYDTTSLDPSGYAKRIHRDYLGHVMRWGWATRQVRRRALKAKHAGEPFKVLEVGCGRQKPLFEGMRGTVAAAMPTLMTMVDLNAVKPTKVAWADVRGEFNFIERWAELEGQAPYDLAVSFEVIEHMPPEMAMQLIDGVAGLLRPGGEFLVSTPVFDGYRAANHVYELTVAELAEMLDVAGFDVAERRGVFASWNDIKKAILADERLSEQSRKDLLAVYDEVAQFYGHDVAACYLAPRYPDASRNNAWMAVKR